MTVITVPAILLGVIVTPAVDLRKRRQGTNRAPTPSRGGLAGKAIELHNPPIQP